jgi:xanthosine utilization system XapX-like protein
MPPLKGSTLSTSTVGRMSMLLPVRMRAAPTSSIVGTLGLWDGNVTTTVASTTATYHTAQSVEFDFTAAAATLTASRYAAIYNNGGNGSILLTADL